VKSGVDNRAAILFIQFFPLQNRNAQVAMDPDLVARVPDGGCGFFVYATEKANLCLKLKEYINLYGKTTERSCPAHPGQRLVQSMRGQGVQCSKPRCTRMRAFQCVHSLLPSNDGERDFCQYGLCNKCAKGGPLHAREREGLDEEQERDPRDPDVENFIDYNPAMEEADEENPPIIEVNQPEPSQSTSVPTIRDREDDDCSVSGQFMLNSFFNCFQRATTNKRPPVKWSQLTSIIQSRMPGDNFILIQAEGLLFPTIFWHQNPDGSVTGALPSVVYSDHSKRQCIGNLASATEHLRSRLKDFTLLTATSPTYRAYTFDVILNHELYHNSIDILFKRGLENTIRICNSINPNPVQDRNVDEVVENPTAKKVAAMQREGQANTFATMTCNDNMTLGVSPITAAIHKHCDEVELDPFQKREDYRHQVLQNHLNMMTIAWHRTIHYFMKTILRLVNIASARP